MTATLNPTKTCTACDRTQPITQFHRNKKTADGHTSTCKDCVRAYKHNNKDKIATWRRNYYDRNKEAFNERSRTDRNRLQQITLKGSYALGTPWTDDDDALLMADDGLPLTTKALTLGRTYSACIARRTRLRKTTA